jgi:peptide/nickel transport system ATP-binding protein
MLLGELMTTETLTSQSRGSQSSEPVLRVEGLVKHFPLGKSAWRSTPKAVVQAVNGLSLDLYGAETIGIVGESGCGKSTAGRTIMRLLEPTAGTISLSGQDVSRAKGRTLLDMRRQMQMVFQDPYSSLNPRQTVSQMITAPLQIHKVGDAASQREQAAELLRIVGLNPDHINRFPHEFSGGQRQRIGLARALALNPKVIIADEPVSALDVSIQAQVINLFRDLQDQMGLSYLFIAHDLSVVRSISHKVIVMYLGKAMEESATDDLFNNPIHPYTRALLSAAPLPNPTLERTRERIILTGDLPSPVALPSGCVFRTRCWKAQEKCSSEVPQLLEISPGRKVACHFPED